MSTDTVFIRHKLDTTQEILETLWREELIAVHYIDDESTDPEHYRVKGETTAAKVLGRLHACLKTGANVAASYRELHPAMLKVGRIDPALSKLWARTFQDSDGGGMIYKVVNLVGVKNVPLSRYPVLTGIQPRGGTLTGWPSASRIVESILSDEPLPMDLSSLHYAQLEVLCHEYLRETGQVRNLLVPIGRNMYEVDICGIAPDGAVLFAQVTRADDPGQAAHKASRLASFAARNARLIYFGPGSSPPHDDRLTFIAVEEVFAHMVKVNRTLVDAMLRPQRPSESDATPLG